LANARPIRPGAEQRHANREFLTRTVRIPSEDYGMAIQHINPPSMHRSPAFSQGTIVPAGARILYVGGQNGVGPDGKVVGDTLKEQTEQALRNVLAVLAEAGATQTDVAKLTITLAQGGDVNAGFAASLAVWGAHPTAITVIQVPAFANPDFLVEIDAIAALPD
jgi:2-iminobutanoate/2-iminopropanoate deaminase